jgi:hypothetical protein
MVVAEAVAAGSAEQRPALGGSDKDACRPGHR